MSGHKPISPEHGTDLAGRTVLVVDDDATSRGWAGVHLGQNGFTVVEATDGEHALEVLAGGRPDLVLLDVDMPRLNGFETCERIRATPGLEALPVVMATGLDDAMSVSRAYASGATDFVTKPINWPLLAHRLPYLIRSGATTSALARSRELLCAAQEMAELGSWVHDLHDDMVSWSDELYRRLGHSPGTTPAGMDSLLERIPEDQRPLLLEAISRVQDGGSSQELVHDVVWPDGSHRTIRHVIGRSHHAGREELHGIALDITGQLAAQHKIHRLAYVDSLTGLPNRARFHEVLDIEIARAGRNGTRLAALFLDLDNFKRINDTLGHGIGDRLLEEVSARLKRTVRSYDTVTGPDHDSAMVARLGGDEFTLLLTELDDATEASGVAQRILETLAEPMRLGGHDVCVTPSIGIAIYPDNGRDANTVLRHADTAMYHAKNSGKNVYSFFDADMDASMQRRLAIENGLRKAIAAGEMNVHYQPQLDLTTARISGVEALARWESSTMGAIGPAEFIPVAEETGLIESIGAWIMERACTDLVGWLEQGLVVPRVAVNISPVQFLHPNFADSVRSVLERTGLDGRRLDIEITEGVVVRDVERAVQVLDDLKRIGVQISVDDFGTGYSSLAQMKQLPIDRLKIDQRFVQQITSSPEDAAITSAVIAMAESMSLDVVAEGVETEAQLSFLARRHCRAAQGFHVSRPMESADTARFLRTHEEQCTVARPEGSGRHVILVVDDDPLSRELVRGILRGGVFDILEAGDTDEGFSLLATHEVDVIIADQVMPHMCGTEFLRRTRKLFPDAARILISGQSNRDALVSAINDGGVFRFVDKTSAADKLLAVVEEALRGRERGGGPGRERSLQSSA